MLITGLAGIVLIEIYAAVMQREFQNTNNRVGKGFAILGIYLFVVCYCKWIETLAACRCGADQDLGNDESVSWVRVGLCMDR
jgi:hypothetical protein